MKQLDLLSAVPEALQYRVFVAKGNIPTESGQTLQDAQLEMLTGVEKGTDCPCCGQLVKLYRRRLHAEMAVFLCKLVKRYDEYPRFYSTREIIGGGPKSSTDGAYLTRWGLVEKEKAENHAGGKAGKYKPTGKGLTFASDRASVASHVFLLCGKVVGFSDTTVTIQECLGAKFSYSELMSTEKQNALKGIEAIGMTAKAAAKRLSKGISGGVRMPYPDKFEDGGK